MKAQVDGDYAAVPPIAAAHASAQAPAEPPPLRAGCALYIDFDGTLVELAERPEAVRVPSGLPGLLERLVRELDGAVAVITGRWLAEVDALLTPLQLPGAGLHGAELRAADTTLLQLRNAPGIVEMAHALREAFGGDRRLLIEDKGAAVALHYRLAPERAAECLRRVRALARERPWLEVVAGNKVVEARMRGTHKGYALRRLSGEPAFAGRTPVFVGDDRSDEDAFAAAAELGGYGVKVGEGATLAAYRCADVAAVHTWLSRTGMVKHG